MFVQVVFLERNIRARDRSTGDNEMVYLANSATEGIDRLSILQVHCVPGEPTLQLWSQALQLDVRLQPLDRGGDLGLRR